MKLIARYRAFFIATVFIILLFTLAVHQLRWVVIMGERERERRMQELSQAAAQLSDAIQEELFVLPVVFRMEEKKVLQAVRDGDWDDFHRRWTTWKVYAVDPSMVAGFHIMDMRRSLSTGTLLTWNGEAFLPEPSADLAASIVKKIGGRKNRSGIGPPEESKDILSPLDSGSLVWFIIRINDEVIAHRLIPHLADRFFSAKSDYFFRIVDIGTKEVIYTTFAAAGTDEIFAHPDLHYHLFDPARRYLTGNAPPRMPPFPYSMGQIPPKASPEKRPLWVLQAVHRSGSLAAIVRAETIRDTILSVGIVILLAVGFGILAMGIRRQQDFVDRQNEFIASITHELKTPIAVIRAAADNLADGVVRDPERTAVYGSAIKRESGRLAEMIDRLLTYARVGDGSLWNFQTIDLRPLAARVVNMYRAQLEDAHFEVDLSLPETPVMLRGDTVALEFAIGNLVANALKHARTGLYLGIDVWIERSEKGASKKGEWAVISVGDRGPGVSRRERKLIFDAFYRGSTARKSQFPGSGIGLVLARRVAEAHGGSIRLAGIGESGTTFVVRLPLEVRDDG